MMSGSSFLFLFRFLLLVFSFDISVFCPLAPLPLRVLFV